MNSDRNKLDTLRRELSSGEMSAFRALYEELKEEFKRFALRYTKDEVLIDDSYHDACISLYENIVGGKLTDLSSSLKTYLFSIGKYTLFNKLRMEGKVIPDEGVLERMPAQEEQITEDPRVPEMRKYLGELGEKCREILILFYYRRFSIGAIVEQMAYKNENTAKAHKSRCLKQLKEKFGQSG